MISKRNLKSMEFEEIEDYFHYIVESEINGNYSQCRDLIKELSNEQFKQYLVWLELDYRQIQKAINWRL